MRKPNHGGGWQAVWYTWRKAREAGGLWKLWRAMRSKNACKTCALGMGGQQGGMVNEAGHFPEVCKKSLQAMVSDMQGAIGEQFWKTYSIPQLQQFTPRELEVCGRLTQPVLLGPNEQYYRPISWEAAYAKLAEQLRALEPHETFWYFSGRSSNEAAFLLQLFARLYGTNNVNNCSYYCHQASGVGLTQTIGSGAGTVQLEDVEKADLVFVIGGNPPSNHPRLMRTLMTVRRNGGQVIVVNPLIEAGLVNFRVPSDVRSMLFGSEIANLYVQPHIGGDLALLVAVAKRIVELGAIDAAFLSAHCDHWPELQASLAGHAWDDLVRKSGVSREQIDDIAARYARAKNAVFSWTMGITHHVHGVENVRAIANLALLRGMVGRPHAGLLPIRGHSNVQGIGTMGVTPKLRDAVFDRLQNHFAVRLPTSPGLDTMGCMESALAGELKFGFCLGGNLYGSNPDAEFARKSLAKLDLITYVSTTLNTGHAHGLGRETLILPALARDEEPEPTTQESMFSYVRLSDGGPRRHEGPKSEIELVADLAGQVLGNHGGNGPLDWRVLRSAEQIRKAIAKIIPGMEQMEQIGGNKQEFQIPGRTFHTPRFATPNGRAQLHPLTEIPELAGGDSNGKNLLRLMTIRSEGQFNTVVYEDYDIYRGIDRRNVILMHPSDMQRLGLQHAQPALITSDVGQMSGVLAWEFTDIKPGNAAMYYPEANVLVPRKLDPQSKTPAFKNVLVSVEPLVRG
ncbi:MAG: FdhF/YdeP family oxidoreductase [Pirellulales bacterium]|nr:FdhF/YdeP family oxidoreductase [Pirellulales bacterium]